MTTLFYFTIMYGWFCDPLGILRGNYQPNYFITFSNNLRLWLNMQRIRIDCFESWLNIASQLKTVKNCSYCCYVRFLTLVVRFGGIPLPQTGATHCNGQLVLPNKGRSIKELVVCMMLDNLIPRVFGYKQERERFT